MGLFDRRHDGQTTRLILEVPLNGNLDKVLRLFVGAVNNVGTGLQAIALALSTPQDNSEEVQRQIDTIASKMNLAATEQQDALDKLNQTKER